MPASPRSRRAFFVVVCLTLASGPNRASAVTVEVARKCKALTDTTYPPREPGNPAAGSEKGSGRAAQDYFNKCVANGGKTDDDASKPAK
jgi:hypothetical protein